MRRDRICCWRLWEWWAHLHATYISRDLCLRSRSCTIFLSLLFLPHSSPLPVFSTDLSPSPITSSDLSSHSMRPCAPTSPVCQAAPTPFLGSWPKYPMANWVPCALAATLSLFVTFLIAPVGPPLDHEELLTRILSIPWMVLPWPKLAPWVVAGPEGPLTLCVHVHPPPLCAKRLPRLS